MLHPNLATRMGLYVAAGILALIGLLLTKPLEPNIGYSIRVIFRMPKGRQPASKPRRLWAAFCLFSIVPIAIIGWATFAPGPEGGAGPQLAPVGAVGTQARGQGLSPTKLPPPSETPGESASSTPPSGLIPSTLTPASTQEIPKVVEIQSPTPTLSYMPLGSCGEAAEPCLYLPKPGESWETVAQNTSFANACRWPEIANVNRGPNGAYRNIGPLLTSAGIFVPIPDRSDEYSPLFRRSDGTQGAIPACPATRTANELPCVYSLTAQDGATGDYYAPLAFKFYGGIEKDHIPLDQWIREANRLDACKRTSIFLLPGVGVVIPMLP